jgi:transmembrane sensor
MEPRLWRLKPLEQREDIEQAANRVRTLAPGNPALLATAASVLILVGATLVSFKDDLLGTDRYTTVIGGLQAIPLSDGSRVTLNTDSEVHIALREHERVVEIDRGEAFFEVAQDAARPFIVKAGERRVIAVGTQFSVRRDDTDVRVVVTEGTVRYEGHPVDAPSAERVLLPAGSVADIRGNAVQVRRLPPDQAEQNLTWRSGFLTFHNTPLAEAVAEFNRYNTRKIVIEDPAIATVEVGGVFRAGNVRRFVQLLEQGFGVQAKAQADRIVLKGAEEARKR